MSERDKALESTIAYARVMRQLIDAAKEVVRLECSHATTECVCGEGGGAGWTCVPSPNGGGFRFMAPNGTVAFLSPDIPSGMAQRIVRLLNLDNCCCLPGA